MDEPRPKIFISTVTKELAKARGKVAETLRLLHFQPVIQEEFPSHTGVVREMLEKELAPCAAVIQIVGHRYGWEVHGAANPTEVMSYTHYEACYAHENKIPIWYLIISDDYLVDHPNDEDETKKLFQTAYRARLQRTGYLYHRVEDIKDVELTVFRMQQELDKLRPPRFQQLPLLNSGNGHAETPPEPAIPSPPSPVEMEKMMRQVLSDFVPALQQAKPNTSPEGDAAEEEKLYSRLASILGKTPDEARAEIAALAKKTKADTSEPLLERAKAAYALEDYPSAEKLALQAAKENPADALAALRQAGQAATKQIQYQRALDHFRAAAALTSRDRDPMEWARAQFDIANTLDDLDRASEVEPILREVVRIHEEILGPDHPDTLTTRNNLAGALYAQRKHAESEVECRPVLAIRERVLGPEHPDTLSSRNNLANLLFVQGKHDEAEREYRAVVAILERVLGPAHPETLGSCFNLSLTLEALGQKHEALEFAKRALAGRNKVLGEDHPASLKAKRLVERLEGK